MSDAPLPNSILSREELDALLEGVAKSAKHDRAREARRPIGLSPVSGSRGELARIARTFADDQARGLSTLYQASVTIRFSHWEEISIREFGAALLDDDRAVKVELGGEHSEAFVHVNRPLLFGWMMLAFGAKPEFSTGTLPSRPYTRIEERFLRRVAEEISSTLARVIGGLSSRDTRVVSLETCETLQDGSSRPHLVASFDVDGLGDMCRFRVALPTSIFEEVRRDPIQETAGPGSAMEEELLDVLVDLQVEVGSAELSVSEVADLRVGSEIPLDVPGDGRLIVRVAGEPKFAAERGTLEQRLAVRVLEAL